MTKYYVSGCIEIDGTVGRDTDEDAEFFTLYEEDAAGLSKCIADFTDRLSAEAVMQVYQDRDALQQQVNALAAENLAIKNFIDERCWVYDDTEERYRDAINYAAETAATDAITRQWMAEALSLVPYVLDGKEQKSFEHYAKEQRLDLEQHPLHYLFLDEKTNAVRNAWRECLNYVAAQLRQPEEKAE